MGIAGNQVAAERSAGESLDPGLAARGVERKRRRGADDLGVVAIGHDHPTVFGMKARVIETGAVEVRGQAPIEPVAVIEVIGPLGVAEQVGAADLDLDDDDPALGVDPHQIGAAVAPAGLGRQRHFGDAPHVVAREQSANPACHRQSGAFLGDLADMGGAGMGGAGMGGAGMGGAGMSGAGLSHAGLSKTRIQDALGRRFGHAPC